MNPEASFTLRPATAGDLPELVELTVEAFRPLFEQHWPALIDPAVFAHDQGHWEQRYRTDVPRLLDPDANRWVTVAEADGRLLGFCAWQLTGVDAGVLELVATRPEAQGRGVGRAVCQAGLDGLRAAGARVVHVGTGGDAFHEPARRLYESLGFRGLPVVDYSRPL